VNTHNGVTRGVAAAIAATVLAAGAALAIQSAGSAMARPARMPQARQATAAPAWSARVIARLSNRAISAAATQHAAYEMLAGRGGSGPFRLQRVALTAGHRVTRGPRFPVSDIRRAAGSLWISGGITAGSSFRLALYQVSPATLRVIRSWRLTPELASGLDSVPVAAGPAGTVWVGFRRTLWRLNPRTGAILARARIGSGLSITDVAVDPAGKHLYVAAAPRRGGAVAREYAARTGRLLASAGGEPLEFAVSGASLTAVPAGAWASFRTGMLGQTVLLRQRGLHAVSVPGRPRLFDWAMANTTAYGGGALWLAVFDGRIGCASPATGHVRSHATFKSLANGGQFLAVDPPLRRLLVFAGSAVVAVTAPPQCLRITRPAGS
jgi:hypothetical protein